MMILKNSGQQKASSVMSCRLIQAVGKLVQRRCSVPSDVQENQTRKYSPISLEQTRDQNVIWKTQGVNEPDQEVEIHLLRIWQCSRRATTAIDFVKMTSVLKHI